MAAEKKLSKRDKKAQAFKKKSKKAEYTEEMAVPQADVVEKEVETPAVKEESKAKTAPKRKASTKIDIPTEDGEGQAKKKNRRPKKNNKEAGSRYIIFVGKNDLVYQWIIYAKARGRSENRHLIFT
jgi:nucleolar protein 6